MTNWTKFIRTDGQTPDNRSLVTLRPVAIAFNAHFIRTNKLHDNTRVSVYCDADRYRLGLKFHSDLSDQDSFALTSDGGSKGGDSRAIQVNALMKQHRWLRCATRTTSKSARRYQPIWFQPDGFWVINIRPSFETRVTSTKEIESGLSGIYRYRNGNQIIYIGRGEIRSRANSPERENWNFDTIEYSVIENVAEQEKWESLWLNEHRNEFGTLPFYNRIGGKRAIEDSTPS